MINLYMITDDTTTGNIKLKEFYEKLLSIARWHASLQVDFEKELSSFVNEGAS